MVRVTEYPLTHPQDVPQQIDGYQAMVWITVYVRHGQPYLAARGDSTLPPRRYRVHVVPATPPVQGPPPGHYVGSYTIPLACGVQRVSYHVLVEAAGAPHAPQGA